MSADGEDAGERTAEGTGALSDGLDVPVIVVLAHPDPTRIGARAAVDTLAGGAPTAISRQGPAFTRGAHRRPLDAVRVSRTPVWLRRVTADTLELAFLGSGEVLVDGARVPGHLNVPWQRVADHGVLLELGGAVLAWLHMGEAADIPLRELGLVGVSPQVVALRRHVAAVARAPWPVLLYGERAVGADELARGIHAASGSRGGPFITVQGSALFAGPSADELLASLPDAAAGGTLYIEGVDAVPVAAQRRLMDAIVEPGARPVRLIASTTGVPADLVSSQRLAPALCSGPVATALRIPPLRERPADVAIHLRRLLASHLGPLGAGDRLAATSEGRPWLGPGVVREVMSRPLRGNLGELDALAFRIARQCHTRATATLPVSSPG